MLKHVLLAGGMMIAVPALAQTSPAPAQTQPGRTATTPPAATTAQPAAPAAAQPAAPMTTAPAPTASTAPTGDAITGQTSPAAPAPTAPADPVVGEGTTQPATPAAAAPAQPAPRTADAGAPAPAQPATQPTQTAAATGTSQVEQIVGREFGAYDKNKDGKLSQGEFDAWMVALKTASDPATKAESPETKQWLGAAFAQADADKSRDLTQAELTGFLSQGQS